MAKKKKTSLGTIAENRKARHNYHIEESFEAGIVLVGSEVKSIRAGKINLADSFARIEKGEAILYGCDIAAFEQAAAFPHTSRRPRKLLLHKKEIGKLFSHANVKGNSLPALKAYWKNGKVKILIGVGKGKHKADKRQDLKARATKLETDRLLANLRR